MAVFLLHHLVNFFSEYPFARKIRFAPYYYGPFTLAFRGPMHAVSITF